MQKTTFIYALCEPGTRTVRYIGKTYRPKRRLWEHLHDSAKGTDHLGRWVASLIRRGEEPDMVILREVTEEAGSDAEKRFIRLARGCKMDLVNATDGGEGVTMTPEIRKKISDNKRGKVTANLGSQLSTAHKAAISKGSMGKIISPKTRAAISAGMKGRVVSPSTRALLSAVHIGKPNSSSHCEAMSKARKGVPWTPAQRAAFERRKQRDQEIEWALAPYTLE